MSKAFTRESDAEDDGPPLAARPALPPGVKNYVTPNGAKRFQVEFAELTARRSALLSEGETAQFSALRNVDARIYQLKQVLESMVVTPPPATDRDVVRFGATVTVREPSGEETAYRIVGADEIDLDRGWISWQSPLARQLLGKRMGGTIRFKVPAGEQQLFIAAVNYD